jgi:hypothetical protein
MYMDCNQMVQGEGREGGGCCKSQSPGFTHHLWRALGHFCTPFQPMTSHSSLCANGGGGPFQPMFSHSSLCTNGGGGPFQPMFSHSSLCANGGGGWRAREHAHAFVVPTHPLGITSHVGTSDYSPGTLLIHFVFTAITEITSSFTAKQTM